VLRLRTKDERNEEKGTRKKEEGRRKNGMLEEWNNGIMER
jgi:hypothetical protein